MKYALLNKLKASGSAFVRMCGTPALRLGTFMTLLIGIALVAAAARAYNHATPDIIERVKPPSFVASPQASGVLQSGRLNSRLSFQPEANKVRHRLGQRFLSPGREQSAMTGTLTIGKQTSLIRIVRTQDDKGERIEIALGGGPASLTWTATEGARAGSNAAGPSERLLIERLALDSPDQFVLAQLRGASYFTVARDATPPRSSVTDDYTGPVWNLIRVAEPERTGTSKPMSLWRLYHINSSTGLIDKVISQEERNVVVEASFSGWVNQAGDWVPSRIIWTSGDQTLMELLLTGVAFGPKQ